MDVTTASPAEIDTEVAATQYAIAATDRALRLPGTTTLPSVRKALGATVERLARHLDTLTAEFARRGGWPRWYLVPGGHLHHDVSDSRCSRRPGTDHYWMTEHSGRAEAEVIGLAGDRVCTVCFVDAPVCPRPATARFMTPGEAESAAYREAAARAKAAKTATWITTPEGAPLIVDGDLVKTDRAAWNRALRGAEDLAWYGPGHCEAAGWSLAVDTCVRALACRRGVTEASLRAELNVKVGKRVAREGGSVRATV